MALSSRCASKKRNKRSRCDCPHTCPNRKPASRRIHPTAEVRSRANRATRHNRGQIPRSAGTGEYLSGCGRRTQIAALIAALTPPPAELHNLHTLLSPQEPRLSSNPKVLGGQQPRTEAACVCPGQSGLAAAGLVSSISRARETSFFRQNSSGHRERVPAGGAGAPLGWQPCRPVEVCRKSDGDPLGCLLRA